MQYELVERDGGKVVLLKSLEEPIRDAQGAMDTFFTIHYETGCDRVAVAKELLCEAFFELRSGIAGDILQKCINYAIKIAIYGDYSVYTSRALRDFIYESNNGRDIFFLPTADEAVERLLAV